VAARENLTPMAHSTVLVVDDQEDVLRTLAYYVGQGGYQVTALSRFEDARRFIDETPPDLLVTDIRLGAFNGLQLVLQLRAARPGAPIVVLSAFDDPTLREEAERAGARYLLKPLGKQELLECLASFA